MQYSHYLNFQVFLSKYFFPCSVSTVNDIKPFHAFKVQSFIIFLLQADLEKQFSISGAFDLLLYFLPSPFVITVPALLFQSHSSLSVCKKGRRMLQSAHTCNFS